MKKRDLHHLLQGFLAESRADGTILVKPVYRYLPGVLTRMALSGHVKKVLNADYRRMRKRGARNSGADHATSAND